VEEISHSTTELSIPQDTRWEEEGEKHTSVTSEVWYLRTNALSHSSEFEGPNAGLMLEEEELELSPFSKIKIVRSSEPVASNLQ